MAHNQVPWQHNIVIYYYSYLHDFISLKYDECEEMVAIKYIKTCFTIIHQKRIM